MSFFSTTRAPQHTDTWQFLFALHTSTIDRRRHTMGSRIGHERRQAYSHLNSSNQLFGTSHREQRSQLDPTAQIPRLLPCELVHRVKMFLIQCFVPNTTSDATQYNLRLHELEEQRPASQQLAREKWKARHAKARFRIQCASLKWNMFSTAYKWKMKARSLIGVPYTGTISVLRRVILSQESAIHSSRAHVKMLSVDQRVLINECRSLENDMDDAQCAVLCIICMQRMRETTFVCGHMVCCTHCASDERIKRCPICRTWFGDTDLERCVPSILS